MTELPAASTETAPSAPSKASRTIAAFGSMQITRSHPFAASTAVWKAAPPRASSFRELLPEGSPPATGVAGGHQPGRHGSPIIPRPMKARERTAWSSSLNVQSP
ncbi:hypothetical protein F2981_21120 (plasmid) [Sinorhizobium meliloti]|nr:hypothetical protein [Sinorhizobium meliloti]